MQFSNFSLLYKQQIACVKDLPRSQLSLLANVNLFQNCGHLMIQKNKNLNNFAV